MANISDHQPMCTQRYQLYVERTDPARNMARFYALEIGQTLFGEACLTRRWGRIGTRGQEKLHVFDLEEDAVSRFLELMLQKRKKGYRPVRSCGNLPGKVIQETGPHDKAAYS